MRQSGLSAAVGLVSLALLACVVLPPGAPTTAVPPPPTLACEWHTASVELSATEARVEVGDLVTVTVTLRNEGCVGLGMPKYTLGQVPGGPGPVFEPEQPEPVVQYLVIPPGTYGEEHFVLRALRPGEATFSASTSFEVHLGYPGPAYWAGASSGVDLVLVVQGTQ